jgi:hypothetical protein
MLTASIGTPEHSSLVRGISSTLPWGKGFREHLASYKKRDRYKKHLEDVARCCRRREHGTTYDGWGVGS